MQDILCSFLSPLFMIVGIVWYCVAIPCILYDSCNSFTGVLASEGWPNANSLAIYLYSTCASSVNHGFNGLQDWPLNNWALYLAKDDWEILYNLLILYDQAAAIWFSWCRMSVQISELFILKLQFLLHSYYCCYSMEICT